MANRTETPTVFAGTIPPKAGRHRLTGKTPIEFRGARYVGDRNQQIGLARRAARRAAGR